MVDSFSQIPKVSIHKFVITGGPCGGKTTALESLQVFFRQRGFRVFNVPEAATIFFLNGASPDDLASVECQSAFQEAVISTQVTLEDRILRYAESTGQPSIILCDRGLMDGSAYVSKETWQGVLNFANQDVVSAREGRYDAIFHLVTAADGAVKYYSLANNMARHESAQEAIEMDRKTQLAWAGHPHHIIVDNSNGKTFEKKVEELVGMVASYVGIPCPLTRIAHKYIISPPDLNALPDKQEFDVEKIMLNSNFKRESCEDFTFVAPNLSEEGDSEKEVHVVRNEPTLSRHPSTGRELYSFIRCRTFGNFNAYGLTTKKQLDSGEYVELKQVISRRMYELLLRSADTSRHKIMQTRYYFLWKGQSYQLTKMRFPTPSPGDPEWTLRVQCPDGVQPQVPPFLTVLSEIDNEEDLSSYTMSLKDRSPINSISVSPSPSLTPPLSEGTSPSGSDSPSQGIEF